MPPTNESNRISKAQLAVLKNTAHIVNACYNLPSLKSLLKAVERYRENKEDDRLGMTTPRPPLFDRPTSEQKKINKLKSLQKLEPLVEASFNFELDKRTRQQKRQALVRSSRKRSEAVHYLEDLEDRKKEADYKMDLIRFDSSVWDDIPRKDQFDFSLNELSEATDLVLPMAGESVLTSRINSSVLSERHLNLMENYLKRATSVVENDFHHKESEVNIAKAFIGYFKYYLWKSGRTYELPKMSDLKFNTALIDCLPYCVSDFHARVLPEILIKQLKERELRGKLTTAEEWYEVFREQTRRLTVLNIGRGIFNCEKKQSTNELFLWRQDYLSVANRLGLHIVDKKGHDGKKNPVLILPDLEAVKDDMFIRLEEIMSDRDAKTLVMGFSGDLDSAFMLILLAEVIRERNLPFKIAAFTLKKDQHKSRFDRIEELISFANRDLAEPIVTFNAFDFEHSFQSFLLSLLHGRSNFSEPTAQLAIDTIKLTAQVAIRAVNTLYKGDLDTRKRKKLTAYGISQETDIISTISTFLTSNLDEAAIAALNRECEAIIGLDIPPVPSEQLINLIAHLIEKDVLGQVDSRFGPREQSNIIHEFVMAIRGNISRSVKWPLTMSGNNNTELAFDNVTTADAFVAWMPLAPYPKAVIAKAFSNIIEKSAGGITESFWNERPLKFLVPWYPDSLRVTGKSGEMKITRIPWFITDFTEVEINPELSCIPIEIWENIHQSGENYMSIDGNVQWYLDPYIHYFMENGLSQSSVRNMIKEYPSRKTDILFTAMLMANAVEKRQKSIYFHQAARHNLAGQY